MTPLQNLSAIAPPPAIEESEAYRTLLPRLKRKDLLIPPEVLTSHVLTCVPPQEWPARVEAAEAVLRRWDAARRDELLIEARPEGGRVLGR
jgi:hypothetical protein